MPSFWRPLGVGPNALPRRSLRRVATSSLRPPPSRLRGPEVPRHHPEGSSSGRADAPRAPGRDLACFLDSTRWGGAVRLQLEARVATGTQATRPKAERTGPESSLPAGSQPGLSDYRLNAEEARQHRGARPREERAERGLAPGRPGLAGPRLRQSAGADAGGGTGALGYQRAGRGAPGARRCGRCAPGRPAAPARSPLRPVRPLALPLLAPVSPALSPSRSLTAQRSGFVARPAPGMAQREHRALNRIRRALAGMNSRAFCLHAQ